MDIKKIIDSPLGKVDPRVAGFVYDRLKRIPLVRRIVDKEFATDFAAFCQRNPQPCPVIGMSAAGFDLLPGEHPIIPVMLGDAKLASDMADALLEEGVYVIGFSFPVVPKGEARIRTQMSAAHTKEDLQTAVDAFEKVGRKLGVIS